MRTVQKIFLTERNSSVGKLSSSVAGNPGFNPGEGLTEVTTMRDEEIASHKSHIAPVSLICQYVILFRKMR